MNKKLKSWHIGRTIAAFALSLVLLCGLVPSLAFSGADKAFADTSTPLSFSGLTTLPDGNEGVAYNPYETTVASYDNTYSSNKYIQINGASGITLSVVDGEFPSGMSLYKSYEDTTYTRYILQGAPTTAGVYDFVLQAENSLGIATAEYTLTINGGIAPGMYYGDGLTGIQGSTLSSLRLNGCSTPVTFSIVAGELPPGVSFSTIAPSAYSDRVIKTFSGAWTTAGTYTFSVKAENAYGSYINSFTVTLPGIALIAPPAFAPLGELAFGNAGVHYLSSSSGPGGGYYAPVIGWVGGSPPDTGKYIQINGATAGITLSVIDGELPPGMSLYKSYTEPYSSTPYTIYILQGTPTTAGAYNFVVQAENSYGSATAEYTLTINDGIAPVFTNASTNFTGTVGATTSLPFGLNGCSLPLTVSVVDGELPPGISVASDADDTLAYSDKVEKYFRGTFTAAGIYTFTLKVENAYGFSTNEFTFNVTGTGSPPSITTTSLPNGSEEVSYDATIAVNSQTTVTYSIRKGGLPAGLVLNPSSGTISGVPIATGEYTFTVKAQNAGGFDTQEYTIVIESVEEPLPVGIAPNIVTTSLPTGKVGTYYEEQILAEGTAPITFSVAPGALPKGLTLNSATGVISGTPESVRSDTSIITATNVVGSVSRWFTVEISEADEPESAPPEATEEPIEVTEEPATPIDPPVVTNEPVAPPVAPVGVAPIITTANIATANTGKYFEQKIAATGTAPILFAKMTGALPAGMSFSQDGVLSGTPESAGAFYINIRAKNLYGEDTKYFAFVVEDTAEPAKPIPTFTGWRNDGGGYSYYIDDERIIDRWLYIKGPKGETAAWRYLDENGYVGQGWQEITRSGKTDTYYFWSKGDGSYATGLATGLTSKDGVANQTYYFDSSGKLQKGWVYVAKKGWLYFDDETGAAAIGWTSITRSGKTDTYYFWSKGDGSYATGLATGLTSKDGEAGKTYYFDGNGKLKTGWQYVKGAWRYFDDETGVAPIGWKQIVRKDANGVLQTYTYYFWSKGDGSYANSGRCYLIGQNGEWGYYTFDKNGHLIGW